MKNYKGFSIIGILLAVGIIALTWAGIYSTYFNKTGESIEEYKEALNENQPSENRESADGNVITFPKNEAKDLHIRSSMESIRIAMELAYSFLGGYQDINCDIEQLNPICVSIESYAEKEPVFNLSKENYCVYVGLINGSYYCINDAVSIETVVFPGQKGYCESQTYSCPK